MQQRLDYPKLAPDAFRAVLALKDCVAKAGVAPLFLDLINLRASQINGCAYCVDMHSKEARAHGAGEQWINLVSAWHESPVFTAAERAVLGWTESLTLVSETHAPDADYDRLSEHFTPEQIVGISYAVSLINVWNRLVVGFRTQHPVDRPAAAA